MASTNTANTYSIIFYQVISIKVVEEMLHIGVKCQLQEIDLLPCGQIYESNHIIC